MLDIIGNIQDVFMSLVLNRPMKVDKLIREQELAQDKILGALALRDDIVTDEVERDLLLNELKHDMNIHSIKVTELGLSEEVSDQIRNLTDIQ